MEKNLDKLTIVKKRCNIHYEITEGSKAGLLCGLSIFHIETAFFIHIQDVFTDKALNRRCD